MSFVFAWEIGLSGLGLFWVDRNAPNEVSVTVNGAWYVFPSWGESSSFCVIGAKNNGQLSMVNPPLFPVNLWLVSSEPWVS